MTDKELLALCADAFDAMPVAANALEFFKSGRAGWSAAEMQLAYVGNRSHILARVMADRVRNHIEADKILSGN